MDIMLHSGRLLPLHKPLSIFLQLTLLQSAAVYRPAWAQNCSCGVIVPLSEGALHYIAHELARYDGFMQRADM